LETKVDHRRAFLAEMDERYAFLDWDEIRAMTDYGIEIGSHTQSHAIVATLNPEELAQELQESKAKIESELQRPCTLFSYPNGTEKDFTLRDQEKLAALGYRAACSQVNGFNAAGENPFALKRMNIVRSQNFSFFQAKVTGVWSRLKGVMN